MAQLLIKAVDATHSDPDKNDRLMYKRGMVIVVKDDDHIWGREEGLPKFIQIVLPGVPVEALEHYSAPDIASDQLERRRTWIVRLDQIPQPFLNRLNQDGKLVVGDTFPWGQFKSKILNQRTGQTETKDVVIKPKQTES